MQVQEEETPSLIATNYAKRLKKLLILASVVVAFLSVVILILIFSPSKQVNENEASTSSTSQSNSAKEEPKICTTKSCIKTANMMFENMNLSVDPCEDFYEFSCGGFVQKTRLADHESATNTFNQLDRNLNLLLSDLLATPIGNQDIEATKNAKKLFSSCLNEKNIEETGESKVLSFVNNQLDGWPVLNPSSFNQDKASTLKKLIKLFENGVSPLFNIYVSASPSDPNYALIKMGQASWFINRK